MKSEITAAVLTYNESANIKACLDSLNWTDSLLVFDSFSEDDTADIARLCGAVVVKQKFEDYAHQRNAALDLIETEWVLFIDADERGTASSAAEIREVVRERPEAGWYIPRHNYIFGKITMGGGWFPDYQLRLFRNGRVHYERPVHEVAVVDGEIGQLKEPLIHNNYRNPAHFHQKQRAYVDLDVRELNAAKIKPKAYTPYSQAVRQFYWRFFRLRGYVDGLHGLRLSSYLAYYEFIKYQHLRQLQK